MKKTYKDENPKKLESVVATRSENVLVWYIPDLISVQ